MNSGRSSPDEVPHIGALGGDHTGLPLPFGGVEAAVGSLEQAGPRIASRVLSHAAAERRDARQWVLLVLQDQAGQPLDETPFGLPQRSRRYEVCKRALDVAGSALLLAASLPVLLIAGLAIRLESGGPVFFGQLRCGRGGRRFRMWKLRTMTHDAEARKRALLHLNEMDGPVFKIRRDPRVTRVGRVLRRYSVDEIPQLWNVLRGEMSLVGPRPWPEELVERQLARGLDYRLRVAAGWTGPAQVAKGRARDYEALDLAYVELLETRPGWTVLRHDLGVLRQTVGTMLRGEGLAN